MGGLLGLGFGFSFISLIEMLYFFGIRRYLERNNNSDVQPRRPILVAVVNRNKHQTVKPAHHPNVGD